MGKRVKKQGKDNSYKRIDEVMKVVGPDGGIMD